MPIRCSLKVERASDRFARFSPFTGKCFGGVPGKSDSSTDSIPRNSLQDTGNGVFLGSTVKTQTQMPRGFKSATRGGFRPDRTGLRKTPSSWLPANEIRKGHPGSTVSRTDNAGKSPFLAGVYDLVCPKTGE